MGTSESKTIFSTLKSIYSNEPVAFIGILLSVVLAFCSNMKDTEKEELNSKRACLDKIEPINKSIKMDFLSLEQSLLVNRQKLRLNQKIDRKEYLEMSQYGNSIVELLDTLKSTPREYSVAFNCGSKIDAGISSLDNFAKTVRSASKDFLKDVSNEFIDMQENFVTDTSFLLCCSKQ